MEFDLLVRKYLRGTLSPPELERLRDLLERVPEYRTELQQILELRSIIQDDALRLVPPSELSDRTRERVGAQFAGIESLLKHDASRLATPGDLSDATRTAVGRLFASAAGSAASDAAAPGAPGTVTTDSDPTGATAIAELAGEEEEPARRAVILPYRLAGRVLLAASIAITVALAPTMLGPSIDAPASGRGAIASAGDTRAGIAGRSIAGADAAGVDAGSAGELASSVATNVPRGSGAGPAAMVTGAGGVTPLAVASVDRSARRTASSGRIAPAADRHIPAEAPSAVDSVSSALAAADDALVVDPENPLSQLLRSRAALGGGYNPSIDSASRSRLEPTPEIALASIAVPGLGSDGRVLSVGVTLGSGNVVDADAPAALMQNSYYFSFSVSGADRIGVEMGGSTFMQETQVPGKRPVGNIFAKQGVGGDSTGGSSLGLGTATTPMVAQRMKQDITYGGVFYDRRLEVGRAWDVCGRVTFGAADGALVAGVRAYTAYSPTRNVTFTLGVGGSKLFDLKGHDDDGSGNYGLYYGIETGF